MPAFIQTIQQAFTAVKRRLQAFPSLAQGKKVAPPYKPGSAVRAAVDTSLPSTLEREIRMERKFSLAEAIGREGGSFMKGESTIPRPLRAIAQINQFITTHLGDPTGALSTTLQTWACHDIRLSRQLDTPLVALDQIVTGLILEPTTFCEFARQVAIAQSKLTGDRPYFQLLDQPPHPDADYTHASIRAELTDLQQHLRLAF